MDAFVPQFLLHNSGRSFFHVHRESASISTEQGHFSLSKHCCHCYSGEITITDHGHLPAALACTLWWLRKLFNGLSDGCRLYWQSSLVLAHCVVYSMTTAQKVEGSISVLILIFLLISVTNREHWHWHWSILSSNCHLSHQWWTFCLILEVLYIPIKLKCSSPFV